MITYEVIYVLDDGKKFSKTYNVKDYDELCLIMDSVEYDVLDVKELSNMGG